MLSPWSASLPPTCRMMVLHSSILYFLILSFRVVIVAPGKERTVVWPFSSFVCTCFRMELPISSVGCFIGFLGLSVRSIWSVLSSVFRVGWDHWGCTCFNTIELWALRYVCVLFKSFCCVFPWGFLNCFFCEALWLALVVSVLLIVLSTQCICLMTSGHFVWLPWQH